jgi:hypothetical protein
VDLSPGLDLEAARVAERRLSENGRHRFQSSLRDEMDCCHRIHGMNLVATIKASLRDAPNRLPSRKQAVPIEFKNAFATG